MHDLWNEHIFWIRNVVLDTLANNTAAATVTEGTEAQTWVAMRQHVYAIADGLADAIEKKGAATFDTSSTSQLQLSVR